MSSSHHIECHPHLSLSFQERDKYAIDFLCVFQTTFMVDGGAIKYISTKYDNAMKAIANNVALIKSYSIVRRDALQGITL